MATQPKQTWLILFQGKRIDLFNAMVGASNADWRALTAQTGLGPFAVSKRMQAMQVLKDIFPQKIEDETDESYQGRLLAESDIPIKFDEGKFLETISALVWLALRTAGDREMTFEDVDNSLNFWEAMGMFQQVSEHQEQADSAGEDEDPKATSPVSDPAAGSPAAPILVS